MNFTLKVGTVILLAGLTACSSTPVSERPDVQTPLKLSEAGDTKRYICGSYGCDDQLRKQCDGRDFKILNQDTKNQYSSRKNNVTGGWDNSRAESVEIIYKCVGDVDTSPTD